MLDFWHGASAHDKQTCLKAPGRDQRKNLSVEEERTIYIGWVVLLQRKKLL